MRTKISLVLPLICSPLAFWGCGDDVTEVNENSYMAVLKSGEKISKFPCDSTRVGDLLFVVDSSATFVCDGKGWESLKGEKGEAGKTGGQGEKGETGAQGEQGEKGKTGSAGTSCTASALESTKDHANGGVKITCGDKSYELWNGKDGEPGKNGKSAYELSKTNLRLEKWLESLKGDQGETGENCSLADDGNGSVKITCGEKTATIYKALCGNTPYEPSEKFCSEGKLYSCGNKPYDPAKQFCDTRDGQTYRTVTIGTQTWMAENLNYADSVKTPSLKGKSWCYGNDPEKCTVTGRFYTWTAAIDSVALAKDGYTCGYGETCDRLKADELVANPIQGVCPSGWHLPSNAEWKTLFTAVGGSSTAGKALKSASGWYEDGNGKDSFGFSALPTGYIHRSGLFSPAGDDADFWSASQDEVGSYVAYFMYLDYGDENAYLDLSSKYAGYSVRCLKN